MDNLSGQIVKGYELRERIGAGGFGAVYRAYQSTVGREVAVKIILPGFANQPEFVRRFETEAQIVARLEHLHIVPLYDYWRDPDGAYLVMRWLRGGSLREALQRGAYDLESASVLLDHVASALYTAHQQQVIHRDLKPGNILLDEDGNAYLADFGIAKDLSGGKEGTTQVDMIVGSPDYLSPEQARSEAVTPQTDIYSLGVVLYELLTGQHPFPNLSSIERLYKHLNEPLPQVDTISEDARRGVNAVIQRATSKNPAHRYADVLAMSAAFREAVASGAKTAPTSVVEMLTPREQQILQSIIEGRSNKDIAAQLFVTVATVKWYITQIYHKLGVRSRVQAIVRAGELHLISKDFSVDTEPRTGATQVPSALFMPENPYKGLRSFEAADHRDFFGREKLTERLVGRMAETGEMSRFLAVVGPSGSGKSSVVKAGLIPALWRGALPGSEKWYIAEMLPGARPLDELEVALTRLATTPVVNLHEQLQRDEHGLLRAANLVLPADGSELVLVIDQFEELFTLVDDEALRVHVLSLLHTAVTEPRSRVRVVVSLRADFYDRPLHYPAFGELLRARMETVLPLGAKDIERAVVAPAERLGVGFEEGLVANIVEDMLYQVGALPLLQYALTELFERRNGKLLTRTAYSEIGGAVGALAKRADALFAEFTADGQEAIHQMFLRLVTVGEGAENTRRRVRRAELLALAQDDETMDEIIDTFVAYRLLALDNDPIDHAPTVEVAHEAILREWERLRMWLEESRSDIVVQRQLSHAAGEWQAAGREASFLLRGSRLAQFEAWAASARLTLTPQERQFIDAGVTQRAAEEDAEVDRQARELALAQAAAAMQRRAASRLRALVVVLAVGFIVSIGSLALAVTREAETETARAEAQTNFEDARDLAMINGAQAAFAAEDLDTARALSIAANSVPNPSSLAQLRLAEAAYAPGTMRVYTSEAVGAFPTSLLWMPDERTVLVAGETSSVISEIELETGETLRTWPHTHTDWVVDMAMRPGMPGQMLTSSLDGRMILWDVVRGEAIRTFESDGSEVNSGQFNPDGRRIVSASQSGALALWDAGTGDIIQTFELGGAPMFGAVFHPDGSSVFGASTEGVVRWSLETGDILMRYPADAPMNGGITLSDDGTRLLAASVPGFYMGLYDVESGQEIRQFRRTGFLIHPRFGRDGATVLAGEGDFITFWDADTGAVIRSLVGHTYGIANLAVSADGRRLLSAASDGTLRLWDVTHGAQIGLATFPLYAAGADISPDGRRFVIASSGHLLNDDAPGHLLLFDMATREELWHSSDDGEADRTYFTDVQFMPDGRALLSSDLYGGLKLWDTETGALLRIYNESSGERQGSVGPIKSTVNAIDIQPDGAAFVAALDGGEVVTWDVDSGTVLFRVAFDAPAVSVAYSPDGGRILACVGFNSSDIQIVLLDAATGVSLSQLKSEPEPCTATAFSSDGQLIATGHASGGIRLWNTSDGTLVRTFAGNLGQINELVFSPDNLTLFSGSNNRATSVTMWEVASGEPYRRLAGHIRPVFGLDISADGHTLLSASIDATARLWRVDTLDELLAWTSANRYVRDLTCSEQELYRLGVSCETAVQ